jgi:hypothetical protein
MIKSHVSENQAPAGSLNFPRISSEKKTRTHLCGRIQINELQNRFSPETDDVDESNKIIQQKIDEA